MATVINTTNVGLSELETAPGGGNTPIAFTTSGRRGWNEGNQGSQTVAFYTWGYGNGSAGGYADPIYGLTPPTTGTNPPLELSDWRGLQYWFDGSPFDVKLKYTNNQTPNPPPNTQQQVDVQIVITDSSGNYSIFRQTPNSPPNYEIFFSANAGQSQISTQIPGFQADSYVLAKNLYWYIDVGAGPDFGGGSIDFAINGTQVLFDTLGAGPFSGTLYDWATGPASGAGLTNSSGCVLEFTIS
jgi:hypothetical protein